MRRLIYIFLFLSITSFGQIAQMSIRQPEIRIGEQTTFILSFQYTNAKGEARLAWPQFDDQLTDHIEILERTVDYDEIIDSNYSIYAHRQEFTITCFEPGIHHLKPIGVELNDSMYYSNPIQLVVNTVEVDTSAGITDIKENYSVEYSFSEQMEDWFRTYWPLLAGGAGAVAIFLLFRLIKNRRPEKEGPPPPPPIPAHITALKSLLDLKKKEAWLMDDKKKYYSELTYTVRLYLEQRFGIQAIEHTTREIIQDLKYADISEEDKMYLRKILSEADMVKFAKMKPENKFGEDSLNKSIDFVEKTKKNEEMEDDQKDDLA